MKELWLLSLVQVVEGNGAHMQPDGEWYRVARNAGGGRSNVTRSKPYHACSSVICLLLDSPVVLAYYEMIKHSVMK